MNGGLARTTIAELAAAGIGVPDGQDALGPLLAAAESRGLASKVVRSARGRRRPDMDCPCYRARVRPLASPRAAKRPAIGRAARGRGENGATALAHALLAWLA
jgi:hypothetical protein